MENPTDEMSAGSGTRGATTMLKKRSINLAGHATSLALEPEFWSVLEEMAQAQRLSLAGLIGKVDSGRTGNPLASACRLAALEWSRCGKR